MLSTFPAPAHGWGQDLGSKRRRLGWGAQQPALCPPLPAHAHPCSRMLTPTHLLSYAQVLVISFSSQSHSPYSFCLCLSLSLSLLPFSLSLFPVSGCISLGLFLSPFSVSLPFSSFLLSLPSPVLLTTAPPLITLPLSPQDVRVHCTHTQHFALYFYCIFSMVRYIQKHKGLLSCYNCLQQ